MGWDGMGHLVGEFAEMGVLVVVFRQAPLTVATCR